MRNMTYFTSNEKKQKERKEGSAISHNPLRREGSSLFRISKERLLSSPIMLYASNNTTALADHSYVSSYSLFSA